MVWTFTPAVFASWPMRRSCGRTIAIDAPCVTVSRSHDRANTHLIKGRASRFPQRTALEPGAELRPRGDPSHPSGRPSTYRPHRKTVRQLSGTNTSFVFSVLSTAEGYPASRELAHCP